MFRSSSTILGLGFSGETERNISSASMPLEATTSRLEILFFLNARFTFITSTSSSSTNNMVIGIGLVIDIAILMCFFKGLLLVGFGYSVFTFWPGENEFGAFFHCRFNADYAAFLVQDFF